MQGRPFVILCVLFTLILGVSGVTARALSESAAQASNGNASQVDGCTPGTAYDPACDADHDGDVDIFDIQLTAGHWNQAGTWLSDNQHNHLGQTWIGSNDPLKLLGAYGTPEFAPLVLANTAGSGLRIAGAAGNGVVVDSAGNYGVAVDTADSDGLFVNSAGDDGLSVNSTVDDGLSVSLAGRNGLYVSSAGGNGVLVDEAALNGFYVQNATLDGFLVLNAAAYGLRVHHSNLDGVAVISTDGDGVDVAAAVDNGIEATGTNRAAYLQGDVEITGICTGCRIAHMAVNMGHESLLPGDIVAVNGVSASAFVGQPMLLQVRRAAPGSTLLGVVDGRAEPYTSLDDNGTTLVRRAGERAAPGDYVAVVIFGPMHVRAAGDVNPGQRVTLGDTDGVRAMRRVTVDGVTLDEGGSSLGVALSSQENGRVWVLVNPQ